MRLDGLAVFRKHAMNGDCPFGANGKAVLAADTLRLAFGANGGEAKPIESDDSDGTVIHAEAAAIARCFVDEKLV